MEGVRSMRKSRDAAVDFAGADALKESSKGNDDDIRFQVRQEHILVVAFLLVCSARRHFLNSV